ncbi:MAG: hypothetical protein P4L50_14730 [Anaerolineaceae bacterium]|nr:hypothetical protein [Anaerolineaceae bacterium]
MQNLWSLNCPEYFWRTKPQFPDCVWEEAVRNSLPILNLDNQPEDIDAILQLILGEDQFGTNHWDLGFAKKTYYVLKPVLPRILTNYMRNSFHKIPEKKFRLNWPTEDRYAKFLWEVIRQVMIISKSSKIEYINFWPNNYKFAFVLTHDVETGKGFDYVNKVADLEEGLGFRSSFNFVPERYPIDLRTFTDLVNRGFEIGLHGLKHDGKLFNSRKIFQNRAAKINNYLLNYDMVGFRSPLTIRQPEWMQDLNIKYDSSFFDTDPFEPIPGGTMSVWPFFIGRFIELPYTLIQDHTLTTVLGEKTPHLWSKKIDFIKNYHGLALINTHPDYLRQTDSNWQIYCEFLNQMKEQDNYWHALPKEIAEWWRIRSRVNNGEIKSDPSINVKSYGQISLHGTSIELA